MLDQNAVLDAHNVRGNPVYGLTKARKSSVHDHKIFFGHNGSRFILQRRRYALDEIEQTVATGLDMSAVLDIVGRPIALGRYVVAFVEESIKSLENERLILLLGPAHWNLLYRGYKDIPLLRFVLGGPWN